MTALGLERVVFIPSGLHPFKGQKVLAPVSDRLEMLRLALADQPGFEVWDIEAERAEISYTVDTVAAWHRYSPKDEPVLLVGADILYELHLWRNWQRILDYTHICLLARPGFVIQAANAPAMAFLERFRVGCVEDLDYQKLGRYGFFTQSVCLLDLSSTELRRRLRTGESLHALTPPSVIDYLQKQCSYTQTNQ